MTKKRRLKRRVKKAEPKPEVEEHAPGYPVLLPCGHLDFLVREGECRMCRPTGEHRRPSLAYRRNKVEGALLQVLYELEQEEELTPREQRMLRAIDCVKPDRSSIDMYPEWFEERLKS